MKWEEIAALILLIGGVVSGLEKIYGFVAKPKELVDKFQDKQEERLKQIIIETIKEESRGIQQSVDRNTETLKLLEASRIERIYWEGKKEKAITIYNQELIYKLYENYKAMGGNGFIDQIMEQIKSWEVVDNLK